MRSWYEAYWQHENRHHELLHEAERERMANAFAPRKARYVRAATRFVVMIAVSLVALLLAGLGPQSDPTEGS